MSSNKTSKLEPLDLPEDHETRMANDRLVEFFDSGVWLDEVQELVDRFSELGIQSDLSQLSRRVLWRLRNRLLRYKEEAGA